MLAAAAHAVSVVVEPVTSSLGPGVGSGGVSVSEVLVAVSKRVTVVAGSF